MPIVWADLAHSKKNKDFVKSELGVSALPSVQLYAGNGLKIDSFPCGPSKVIPVLKPKLVRLIQEHVDIETGQLKNKNTKSVSSSLSSVSSSSVSSLSSQPIVDVVTATSPSNVKSRLIASPPPLQRRQQQHPLRFFAILYKIIRSKWLTIVANNIKNNHNHKNKRRRSVVEGTLNDKQAQSQIQAESVPISVTGSFIWRDRVKEWHQYTTRRDATNSPAELFGT